MKNNKRECGLNIQIKPQTHPSYEKMLKSDRLSVKSFCYLQKSVIVVSRQEMMGIITIAMTLRNAYFPATPVLNTAHHQSVREYRENEIKT